MHVYDRYEIARILNVHPDTVYEVAKRNGFDFTKNPWLNQRHTYWDLFDFVNYRMGRHFSEWVFVRTLDNQDDDTFFGFYENHEMKFSMKKVFNL